MYVLEKSIWYRINYKYWDYLFILFLFLIFHLFSFIIINHDFLVLLYNYNSIGEITIYPAQNKYENYAQIIRNIGYIDCKVYYGDGIGYYNSMLPKCFPKMLYTKLPQDLQFDYILNDFDVNKVSDQRLISWFNKWNKALTQYNYYTTKYTSINGFDTIMVIYLKH